jgi:GT2 family glycosyltransferase
MDTVKILIGMPTDGNLTTEFVDSYIGLLFNTQKHFQNVVFQHYFIKGVRTDKNRNQIVDKFLKDGYDYLLFLDTDMTYPKDIIIKYIESGKELIGCVYFKRVPPHHPVLYKFSNNSDTPFSTIDPISLPQGVPVEVDGLGTGGMFIKRSVFEKLEAAGRDPWFKYGDNYHLPYKTANQTTHDLMFCKKAKDIGIEIFVHTGVYCGHLETREATKEDWLEHRDKEIKGKSEDFVTIIVPAYGLDAKAKLYQTLSVLEAETDGEYEVLAIIDGDPELFEAIKAEQPTYKNTKFLYSEQNQGYGNTVNEAIQNSKSDYFIYLAQDVLPGRNWLVEAMRCYKQAFPEKDGLLTFNDGKWYGEIACHGLLHRNFIKKFTGETLFYPGYKHYHVDRELTEVAKKENKLLYAYNSVVYHLQAKQGRSEQDKSLKKGLETAQVDWELFLERQKLGFPLH